MWCFLPTAYGEKGGTTTNIEGRVSRLAQLVTSPSAARDDWMIASELAWRLGGDLEFSSMEEIWSEIEQVAPSHNGITLEQIWADETRDGILIGGTSIELAIEPSGETPVVDGYGLRLISGRRLYDAGTQTSNCASLSALAQDAELRVNPTELERLGIQDGSEVTIISTKGNRSRRSDSR